jgi:hypothetical protein
MRRVILLALLGLGTTVAQADNGLFYLGAGITETDLKSSYGGYIAWTPAPYTNPSWKAYAGVRPLNWLGAEVDYIKFGSATGSSFGDTYTTSTTAHSSAWAAYAVGFLPIPLPVVDLYAKVGVARWKQDAIYVFTPDYPPLGSSTVTPLVSTMSFSGTDFAWGVGVQAHIKMFGVRLEYEGFQVNNQTASIGSLSVFLSLW